ncbi:hypothetical protein KR093_009237, partial [Drosophila rubida]
VFDLLCAVLFAVLSLCLIITHRNSEMVRYWIMFSCFGILIELILIVYAFMSNTTFQSGVIRNSFILCLGLTVEAIFVFIIYQFYLAVSSCNTCLTKRSTPDCSC